VSKRKKKKVQKGWPLGFAPPGPRTRKIKQGEWGGMVQSVSGTTHSVRDRWLDSKEFFDL
jgi:hypothetical protein